ncbi:unnamed protein product [Paramecium pentaurelia]|uniref:Uncharacterized protein n=1 Tax=Paramecium pentaurelia TaxID=43138 RepID=A0A8S1UDG8_9CILI|nr:unnamed protein product [Paramecium pentaurelia]
MSYLNQIAIGKQFVYFIQWQMLYFYRNQIQYISQNLYCVCGIEIDYIENLNNCESKYLRYILCYIFNSLTNKCVAFNSQYELHACKVRAKSCYWKGNIVKLQLVVSSISLYRVQTIYFCYEIIILQLYSVYLKVNAILIQIKQQDGLHNPKIRRNLIFLFFQDDSYIQFSNILMLLICLLKKSFDMD